MAAIDGPPKLDFRKLSHMTNSRGFNCGQRELDQWFKRHAIRDNGRGTYSVTCGYTDASSPRPVGFYAIATVAEEVAKLPGQHYHRFGAGDHFSCLQLVWLATDRGFQGQGIGSLMVGEVIALFAEIGPQIGLPHLIVVPLSSDLTPFYEDLGFEPYDGGTRMFLPIQSAIDAFK